MHCERLNLPSGGFAIVCGRARKPHKCCACSKPSAFQCDWKTGGENRGKPYTCDAHLCADHALEVAPGKHVCPLHLKAFEAWKQRRQARLDAGG